MSTKGRVIRACFGICVISAILCSSIFTWKGYVDWQSCLCSQLTDEIQQFDIDKKLLDVYDITETRSGTFIQAITHCKHDERLQLTIFPDEGFYYGCKNEK